VPRLVIGVVVRQVQVDPATKLKNTLGRPTARKLAVVSIAARPSRPATMNTPPMTVFAVEANVPPMRAATSRNTATTIEVTESRPLLDMPITCWPFVLKNGMSSSRPMRPKTSRTTADRIEPQR
jgi:hypothetical protein